MGPRCWELVECTVYLLVDEGRAPPRLSHQMAHLEQATELVHEVKLTQGRVVVLVPVSELQRRVWHLGGC